MQIIVPELSWMWSGFLTGAAFWGFSFAVRILLRVSRITFTAVDS